MKSPRGLKRDFCLRKSFVPTKNPIQFETRVVVVSYAIDPGAYGIAPHQPGIARLQQFGRGPHISHAGIEP